MSLNQLTNIGDVNASLNCDWFNVRVDGTLYTDINKGHGGWVAQTDGSGNVTVGPFTGYAPVSVSNVVSTRVVNFILGAGYNVLTFDTTLIKGTSFQFVDTETVKALDTGLYYFGFACSMDQVAGAYDYIIDVNGVSAAAGGIERVGIGLGFETANISALLNLVAGDLVQIKIQPPSFPVNTDGYKLHIIRV